MRPDPLAVAREFVRERFPQAVQAWLAGSTVTGTATATSDLDITVLLADTDDVHRESLTYQGWPVEVFVHTETSIRHFVHADTQRRRPTMARMVATGNPLLPGTGGDVIRAECAATIEAGPAPASGADFDLMRYLLTDLVDDLLGLDGSGPVADAVIVEVWRSTAEFVLVSHRWWSGSGKWLVRELEALDCQHGTEYAGRLHEALHRAINGEPRVLVAVADDVLAMRGGRLWAGYSQSASI